MKKKIGEDVPTTHVFDVILRETIRQQRFEQMLNKKREIVEIKIFQAVC